MNTSGEHVVERKIPQTGMGFTELVMWLSEQTNQAETVNIGAALETSGGPVVECLFALGYCVFAINPKQADRFWDRYSPAGV